jgi:Undecaprenyl-phosphate galactose phosphotransferase WbaP
MSNGGLEAATSADVQALAPRRLEAVDGGRKSARSHALPLVTPSTRPWLSAGVLAASDLLALLASVGVAMVVRQMLSHDSALGACLWLCPLVVACMLVYGTAGLYRVWGVTPAEELRRATLGTTIVFVAFACQSFLFRTSETYSRQVLLTAWAMALVLVPLLRGVFRGRLASRGWWGHSTLVLGAGPVAQRVVNTLKRNPTIGLKVVALLDDDFRTHGTRANGVPVVGDLALAPQLVERFSIQHAVVAMPDEERARLGDAVERHASGCTHVIVIPELFAFSNLWAEARDLGGVFALETRRKLQAKLALATKRLVDVMLGVLALLVALPVMLVIALAIKIDSRGPLFHGGVRWGQGGKLFRMWKFRSMVANAEDELARYFEENPGLREEFERTQKLRSDPRVTTLGRFLRKTSLDELPQLWNILTGDMSLVGPRPVPRDEVARYRQVGEFSLYTMVKPGLTGMWQVCGRNNVSYEERVQLNAYYVRNWSMWLDLHIMARTVPVVLTRKGAC